MPAESEVGVDPFLECRQAKLLEPHDLGLREWLPGKVGERCAAPEREGGPQRVGSTRWVPGSERGSPFLAEADELEEVDGVRLDDEPIAGRRRLEYAFRQELPELRDVNLEGVARRVGRLVAPERVDEPIARDDPICIQEQNREQGAPLLPSERDRLAVQAHGDRTEEAELGASSRHRRGLTTISGRLQRFFSAPRKDRVVNSVPDNSPKSSAAITGGTAVAVAGVPSRERRSHEERQHLELGPSGKGEGGASAPPAVRPIRWLP